MGLFRSPSQRHLDELISQYDGFMAAEWPDESALKTVFSLAERFNISDEARSALCSYPPIAQAIAAHRDDPVIKTFMRDPDAPMFHFPG
jgi:hypothetical protein